MKIKLSRLITKSISSRQAIQPVRDKIFALPKHKDFLIELDFTDIDFISRSFADEILKLKEKMENKKMCLKFINKNSEINRMLKIVSSQRMSKKSRKIDISVRDLETVAYLF